MSPAMEPSAPGRQLRVPAEMERLNKMAEVLAQSVSSLADRLNCVLSAPRVEADCGQELDGAINKQAPALVEQLSELATRLDRTVQRLHDLTSRLEV